MRNGALWEHSRHWLNLRSSYAFGEFMLENFPLSVGYGITWGASVLAHRFSPDQRRSIGANVRHVLQHTQPSLSRAELDRKVEETVFRVFVNRGVWFADLSVMASRRQLDGLFQYDMRGSWPELQRAMAAGKGAILASAHIGNWHGGGVIVARQGIPVRAVMYHNHASDFMDQRVARRGNVQQTYIDSDPMAMMEIVRALKRGEALAMLVDKPWDSRSMPVPFFGKPSRFPIGPVRLARMSGAPIFPAFCVWREPRRYEAVLCDPIEVRGADPEEAEREALSKLARVIEGFVASYLTVWFNFTPVWDLS